MERKFFGRHYAWAMVVGSFVFLMVSWGIIFNTHSLFLVPIEESLGITRAQTMIAITIRGAAMTGAALIAGSLYSRFKFLSIIRITGVFAVATYALTAFMRSEWQYYVLSALLVITMTLCGLIPMAMMINRWFKKQTGAALGFAMMGSGVGGMIFNLVAGYLIPGIGWRETILVFAALLATVMFFMQYKLFVYEPEDIGMKPYGYEEPGEESEALTVNASQGSRTKAAFWVVAIGIVMMNMAINVLLTNTVPHLTANGVAIVTLSRISSVIMLGMAVGKVILGMLYDQIGMKYASMLTSVSFMIGFAGLLIPSIPASIWLSAIGTGFGSAFNSIAPPVFAQALYDQKQFTRANAYFQAIGSFGMIVGPVIVGFLYDRSGNYLFTFQLFLGLMALSAVLWAIFLPSKSEQ